MRYVSWLRRILTDAAQWLRGDVGHRREGNLALGGDRSDDQDDPYYAAFLGPPRLNPKSQSTPNLTTLRAEQSVSRME